MSSLKASIIVPARNESAFINIFLERLIENLKSNVEILIIVDSNEDSAPAHSKEVFYAHKLVLKTSAKGSILDTLSDAEELPVPIIDVSPEVFRIMLFHVYGGEITADVWKTHVKDVLEASDKYGLTNLKIEAEAWYVKLQKFTPSIIIIIILNNIQKLSTFLYTIHFLPHGLDACTKHLPADGTYSP